MSQAKTRNISIRATDAQYQSIKDFAGFQGKSVSALMLDAVWETIEDFEDKRDIQDFLDNDNGVRHSWDEVKTAAGL